MHSSKSVGTKGLGSGRWRLGWSSALADFHRVADSSVTDDMICIGILTIKVHLLVGVDFLIKMYLKAITRIMICKGMFYKSKYSIWAKK